MSDDDDDDDGDACDDEFRVFFFFVFIEDDAAGRDRAGVDGRGWGKKRNQERWQTNSRESPRKRRRKDDSVGGYDDARVGGDE